MADDSDSSSSSYSSDSSSSSSSSSSLTMANNALGSAVAGIVSRTCTHPLDTAKARLQAPSASTLYANIPTTKRRMEYYHYINNNNYRGPWHVLQQTARLEGIRGLYRGFGTVIVGGTPGTVLYLCSYELAKERLVRLRRWYRHGHNNNSAIPGSSSGSSVIDDKHDFLAHFGAGMMAEMIACIIYVPVDVIKERMQVQERRQPNHNSPTSAHISSSSGGAVSTTNVYYRSTWDAVRQISQTEGLRGLYRGYAATLASFGPFSALYFLFYEEAKRWSRQQHFSSSLSPPSRKNNHPDMEEEDPDPRRNSAATVTTNHTTADEERIPFAWLVLCSAGSGALAAWLTSPLDFAKLRLQVQRGQQQQQHHATTSTTTILNTTTSTAYRGVWDCLQTTFRHGGLCGLFRGAGARVLHFAPATTITMTTYDICRHHNVLSYLYMP